MYADIYDTSHGAREVILKDMIKSVWYWTSAKQNKLKPFADSLWFISID